MQSALRGATRKITISGLLLSTFFLCIVVALGWSVQAQITGYGLRPTPTPPPFSTRKELETIPEEHLFYPNSQVISHFGTDVDRSLFVASRASSGYRLGANDAQEVIVDFYRRELLARGWYLSDKDTISGSGEGPTLSWRKGNLVFRATILRGDDPREPLAASGYTTPYRIEVFADLPTR